VTPDANFASSFDLSLRLPGQRYDSESGLNYNYYRDYDAGTGRYIESDQIGLRGGPSTYAYVSSSPTNLSDKKGLCTCIADDAENTKKDDRGPPHWFYQDITVTCSYKCTDNKGKTEKVKGTYKVRVWHTRADDDGREGNCIEQRYGNPVEFYSGSGAPKNSYPQSGFDSFNPLTSTPSSPDLVAWAKSKCCQ
jgi:RHS repeat-associated protein